MDGPATRSYRRGMAWFRPVLLTFAASALVVSTLATAPASAAPARELRRDGDHFPVSVKTTVPAGGSSTVTTPTLGRDTEKVKVTVKPQAGASADETDSVDDLTHVLGTMSKGERLLLCVMLHQIVVAMAGNTDNIEFRLNARDSALTMLGACLRLTGLIAQKQTTAAKTSAPAPAGQTCDSVKPKVPATLEKVDDGYEITVDGDVTKTKNPRLKVGCRVKGSRVIYKVRAARQGVPLRRVVGKRLSIGMSSPSDAPAGAPVRVTFATP